MATSVLTPELARALRSRGYSPAACLRRMSRVHPPLPPELPLFADVDAGLIMAEMAAARDRYRELRAEAEALNRVRREANLAAIARANERSARHWEWGTKIAVGFVALLFLAVFAAAVGWSAWCINSVGTPIDHGLALDYAGLMGAGLVGAVLTSALALHWARGGES